MANMQTGLLNQFNTVGLGLLLAGLDDPKSGNLIKHMKPDLYSYSKKTYDMF